MPRYHCGVMAMVTLHYEVYWAMHPPAMTLSSCTLRHTVPDRCSCYCAHMCDMTAPLQCLIGMP